MKIKILKPHNTGYTVVWAISILDNNGNKQSSAIISSYELAKLITGEIKKIKNISDPNSRGRRKIFV